MIKFKSCLDAFEKDPGPNIVAYHPVVGLKLVLIESNNSYWIGSGCRITRQYVKTSKEFDSIESGIAALNGWLK